MTGAGYILDAALLGSTLLADSGITDRTAIRLNRVAAVGAYFAAMTLVPLDPFQSMFMASFLAFVFIRMAVAAFWKTNRAMSIGLTCFFMSFDLRLFIAHQYVAFSTICMIVLFSTVQMRLLAPFINSFISRTSKGRTRHENV